MRFEFTDIDGKPFAPENIISYELSSEVGAACDGLRINFVSEDFPKELVSAKAFIGEKLVFNGFCDNQKTVRDESGLRCFVFARSSAALLVDNEAPPCEYNCPSARQLWYSNARELGFECGLPELYSKNSYIISKGTSRFGVINDFVLAAGGTPVYVTPENVMKAYEPGKDLKRLEDYRLVSLTRIINRSEVISDIDYKINASDAYSYHFKSDYAHGRGIVRKRLCNLSAIPTWQREFTAKEKIIKSLEEYICSEAVISGECEIGLFDRVQTAFGDEKEEFFVSEIVRSKSKNGEKTVLLMKKKIDGEIVNYVAQ